MPVMLDHTIIPSKDHEAAARLFAQIFGVEYEGLWGHFAPVEIGAGLTLDFDKRETFEGHHYAFLVSDEEFDSIFGRVKEAGLNFGSGPMVRDGEINNRHMGRGVYFDTPDGHNLEIITHTYVR